MGKFEVFEYDFVTRFVLARQKFTKDFLAHIRKRVEMSSAVDVGCGLGDFSGFLHDLGFQVRGLDGREENVEECRRRHPGITFERANAEDLLVDQVGKFDLVLCFGLLYHLENPFRAVRGLRSITGQVLLIESMCAPGVNPAMELLDEPEVVNQGLNYVAFYPTESCLVKMLYRSGFRFVYGFRTLPDYSAFYGCSLRQKERTMLAASDQPLEAPGLKLLGEPTRPLDIWQTHLGAWRARIIRLSGPVRMTIGRALRGQRSSAR